MDLSPKNLKSVSEILRRIAEQVLLLDHGENLELFSRKAPNSKMKHANSLALPWSIRKSPPERDLTPKKWTS